MSTFKFRLPDLKNKSYANFEEKLTRDFAEQLKKLDASYVLEVIKTADTYDLRVREITLPVIYTIVCSISKVEVTINPNTMKDVKPEVTGLLFNFIVDYLEI